MMGCEQCLEYQRDIEALEAALGRYRAKVWEADEQGMLWKEKAEQAQAEAATAVQVLKMWGSFDVLGNECQRATEKYLADPGTAAKTLLERLVEAEGSAKWWEECCDEYHEHQKALEAVRDAGNNLLPYIRSTLDGKIAWLIMEGSMEVRELIAKLRTALDATNKEE